MGFNTQRPKWKCVTKNLIKNFRYFQEKKFISTSTAKAQKATFRKKVFGSKKILNWNLIFHTGPLKGLPSSSPPSSSQTTKLVRLVRSIIIGTTCSLDPKIQNRRFPPHLFGESLKLRIWTCSSRSTPLKAIKKSPNIILSIILTLIFCKNIPIRLVILMSWNLAVKWLSKHLFVRLIRLVTWEM